MFRCNGGSTLYIEMLGAGKATPAQFFASNLRRKSAAAPMGRVWCSFHFSLNSRPPSRPQAAFQGSPWGELSPEATERGPIPRPVGEKPPLCKGGCQPNRDPNATQHSGCVWERRRDGANEKYCSRYLERCAVRDDEGDCNLHDLFCLKDRQRTKNHNPSTAAAVPLPLHRGGLDGRRELNSGFQSFFRNLKKPVDTGGLIWYYTSCVERYRLSQLNNDARVVELVDSLASGASARKGVRVRLPPRAPEQKDTTKVVSFCFPRALLFPSGDPVSVDFL